MSFVEKISDAYRKFARKRADRKLLREMYRELPDMMREMDMLAANLARTPHSIADIMADADIMAEARKYNHVITIDEQLQVPPVLVEIPAPPFNTDACTILQNPMNVPRQPLRFRQPS